MYLFPTSEINFFAASSPIRLSLRLLTDYWKSILTNRYNKITLHFIYIPSSPQVWLKTRVMFQFSRFLSSRHIPFWLVIGSCHTLRGTAPRVHCEDVWSLAVVLLALVESILMLVCALRCLKMYALFISLWKCLLGVVIRL